MNIEHWQSKHLTYQSGTKVRGAHRRWNIVVLDLFKRNNPRMRADWFDCSNVRGVSEFEIALSISSILVVLSNSWN